MRQQIVMNSSFLGPWIVLFVLMLAFFLESCAQSPAPYSVIESIPVPSAGYDVEEYSLKLESAYQINFKINETYPGEKMLDFYADLFIENGWHVCANEDEWVEYDKRIEDKTDIPTRQKLQYLASRNEKRLLLVALRYFGYQKTGSKESRKWNNEVQHVTVVLYDLSGKDFDKTLSLLSLRCSF